MTSTSVCDSLTNLPAKPVLRARGLKKSFGGQKVLDSVSISLFQGEVVLLRGDNGAGKTTLLNILTGNLEPDAGVIQVALADIRENFHFPTRWWTGLNPFNHFTPERIANEGIGRTWQDVRLFSTIDLRDNIAVATPEQIGENPLLALARPKASNAQAQQSWKEADAILARLGLGGRENSSADKISLGQSKRVAIARAVQAGAKILFLDEPLAGLDSAGIKEILRLLKELSTAKGITLVIVEHFFNIPEILKIATTVWSLDKGHISRELPNQAVESNSGIPGYSFDEWMRLIAGDGGNIHQSEQHGARVSTIEPPGSKESPSVLQIEDLLVYRNKRLVVGAQNTNQAIGVSLSLRKGQLVVLQAPNGWGKTTLLEAIAGLIPATRGQVSMENQSLNSKGAWLRAKLGLHLLQSRNNFFPNLTVRESLTLAKLPKTPTDIQSLEHKMMSSLSGGELQRVVTTCALENAKYSAILLDEPFAALDPAGVEQLTNRLKTVLQHAGILLAVPSATVVT